MAMATTQPQQAIKVMVVGDSISHGREGDWTWRYRIWEWFNRERVPVRFVGPFTGTSPPDEPHPPLPPRLIDEPPDPWPPLRTHGGYAAGVSSGFLANSDHFSASGRQAGQAKDLVAEQVAAYQPDLLLVELGFNDLGWSMCHPVQVLQNIKHLVDQARSAKRDLKFAIADIPQRTDMPGREDLPASTAIYNKLLAASIPRWSSLQSPIALVRFCENYSCGGTNSDAAYDGLHPNALGEYQLAQAFSHTLVSSFSLGRNRLPIPAHIPPRPLPTPANLRATPGPCGIVITWTAVYGAYSYDLQHRRAGDTAWSTTPLPAPRYDWLHLPAGQTIHCRVRASAGDSPALKSAWSGPASATADPHPPPPPTGIRTRATPSGFAISWTPPPPPLPGGAVDRYGVTYFDGDASGAFPCTVGVRGGEVKAEVRGLVPGHRYFIAVATWTSVGGGLPAGARAVRVGGDGGVSPPHVPRGVWAEVREAAQVVEVSWGEVAGAAGYDVWVREARRAVGGGLDACGGARVVKSVGCDGGGGGGGGGVSCDADGRRVSVTLFMEPTGWDWAYAVRAYNGNDESGLSEWVTPPPLDLEKVTLTEGDSLLVEIRHG